MDKQAKHLDTVLLITRLVVGIIFMAHGAQKVFGMFGGPGLDAVVNGANGQPGMGPLGYLVSIGEFFGGLGLVVGFLSRFSAASLIVIMLGAINVHLIQMKGGFFLPTGFEYPFALIGLLVPTLILGPGSLAIGRYLPLPKRKDNANRPNAFIE